MSMKIYELVNDKTQLFKVFEEKIKQKIHVAAPAKITSIDYEKQTLNAQITIREKINGQLFGIPELLDVPFFVLGGGDYSLTFPIKKMMNASLFLPIPASMHGGKTGTYKTP